MAAVSRSITATSASSPPAANTGCGDWIVNATGSGLPGIIPRSVRWTNPAASTLTTFRPVNLAKSGSSTCRLVTRKPLRLPASGVLLTTNPVPLPTVFESEPSRSYMYTLSRRAAYRCLASIAPSHMPQIVPRQRRTAPLLPYVVTHRVALRLLHGSVVVVVVVEGFDLADPEVAPGPGGGAAGQVTELLGQSVEPGTRVVGVKVGDQGGDHEPGGRPVAFDDQAEQVAHRGTLILPAEIKTRQACPPDERCVQLGIRRQPG